jgi:outer membrane lipoprotein-sorting protein
MTMNHRTRTCLWRITLLLATVLLLSVAACSGEKAPANSQSSDHRVSEAIAAIVDAYGGVEALGAISGYHMRGDQFAVQTNATIRVERWFARPDRLRLELAYPDHLEVRYTDGENGWAGSTVSSLLPANPMKLQAMRLQTARFDPPLRLLENESRVEWRDTDEKGRIVLRLAIDADLYIDYHVNPASHRIERMLMRMPGPPEMFFAADYDQFHEIDGVLIPFREVTYAGATVTSRFQVTEFEWNPKRLDFALQQAAAGSTL